MITVRPYKQTVFFEYDIRITKPDGELFVERKKTDCKTETSAKRFADQRYAYLLKTGFSTPEVKPKSPLTLAEFWPKYQLHMKAERRKPTTQYNRATQYNRHIDPLLGSVPIAEIGPIHVAQIKAALAGFAAASVNQALNCLSVVLGLAHQWEVRGERPRIKYLPKDTKETKPYTNEEIARLLEASTTTQERAFLFLGVDAGLRVGEMAALRRDDIDLKAKRIEIKNNLSMNVETTPKSEAGKRTVYLTARLVGALSSHLKTHTAPRVLWVAGIESLSTGTLQRLLGRIERRAGLPSTRNPGAPHRLRHSFASRLAAAGATAKEIAALLGHTTLRQAEEYIHLHSSDRPRAIQLLEATEK